MADGDIQVILNELKHIRNDIKELKNEKEGHDAVKLEVALLKEKLKDYDSLREKVSQINTEKSLLSKAIPYAGAVIAWLIGGGWKFFVG